MLLSRLTEDDVTLSLDLITGRFSCFGFHHYAADRGLTRSNDHGPIGSVPSAERKALALTERNVAERTRALGNLAPTPGIVLFVGMPT